MITAVGLAIIAVAGAAPVQLSAERSVYPLVEHVEYLQDAGGELELAGAMAAEGWATSAEEDPNFGFTSAAYWLRLELHNATDDTQHTVFAFRYQLLDDVLVYVQQLDGSFTAEELGDRRPFWTRSLRSTRLAVVVETAPGQRQWLYARVATSSSMQIGAELMSYEGFIEDTTQADLFRGVYYGIMVVMAVYNLFLYLSIRNLSYLLYVAFVVAFIFTQMALDGTSTRYLFPDSPSIANTFTPFMIGLLQLPVLLFTQRFLKTKEHVPRLHTLLNVFLALATVGVALTLVAPYAISVRYVAGLSMIESLACQVIGIIVWRMGFRPARFYVLAWSALIIGTIMYAMVAFGWLPANVFTRNIQRFGSALEVTLLSFALGDWIKMLEQERERARAEHLELERDLAVTAAVQQMLLPKDDVVTGDDVSLAGFYRPATQCGGDWWWHERLPDGRTLVLLGDVTGHGAGAAMMTAAVAAGYRSYAQRDALDVEQLLRSLDATFRALAGGIHQMSMSAVVIDAAGGNLELFSAGGPAVLVLRADGSSTHLVARSHLLGGSELNVGRAACELGGGDRVLVFSDGLTEMIKPNGRQLGYRGVLRLVEETRSMALVDARAAIVAGLDLLRGGAGQLDDYTFVLIEAHSQTSTRRS